MMRIATVMDRLTAQLVPSIFVAIGGLGAIPAKPEAVKWQNRASVVPRPDLVGANDAGTGIVSQRVVRVVRVLIGFTRQNNQRRIGNLDSIEDVVEAVKAALIGWTPTGETSPVEYVASGVEYQDLETGLFIWGVDVGCPYHLET
jgi:hypothetical protein